MSRRKERERERDITPVPAELGRGVKHGNEPRVATGLSTSVEIAQCSLLNCGLVSDLNFKT